MSNKKKEKSVPGFIEDNTRSHTHTHNNQLQAILANQPTTLYIFPIQNERKMSIAPVIIEATAKHTATVSLANNIEFSHNKVNV